MSWDRKCFTYVVFLVLLRFFVVVILEASMLQVFNNGNEDDGTQSAPQANDEKQWYRQLYLLQEFLFICSGDLCLAIDTSLLIGLIKTILDVEYNYYAGVTLIMMKGIWQTGNIILLAWGFSNHFLFRTVKERHDYVLYRQ